MKSELKIVHGCFYHFIGRKEVLKLENEVLFTDLLNQTNGRKIPTMKRVSLKVEDNSWDVHVDFYRKNKNKPANLSYFDLAEFRINKMAYETLLREGEYESHYPPLIEVYFKIIDFIKPQVVLPQIE